MKRKVLYRAYTIRLFNWTVVLPQRHWQMLYDRFDWKYEETIPGRKFNHIIKKRCICREYGDCFRCPLNIGCAGGYGCLTIVRVVHPGMVHLCIDTDSVYWTDERDLSARVQLDKLRRVLERASQITNKKPLIKRCNVFRGRFV